MGTESFRAPTYDLETVKALIRGGDKALTKYAYQTASNLGFTEPQVYGLVLRLTSAHFYKTMESKFKGLFQDVYHYKDAEWELYIKVQIVDEGGKTAKIIDFKTWT